MSAANVVFVHVKTGLDMTVLRTCSHFMYVHVPMYIHTTLLMPLHFKGVATLVWYGI